MKVQITGQYTNGALYRGFIPKESITEAEAIELIANYDIHSNESKSDGAPLDYNSLSLTLFDDFEYLPVRRAALFIALDEYRLYDQLINTVNYMANQNAEGKEMKFWLDSMQTLERSHTKVNKMQLAMSLTDSQVNAIFKRAMEIQAQNF